LKEMRIAVDICNTVANVNRELAKRFTGFSLNLYPSPIITAGFFGSPEGLQLLNEAAPIPYAALVLQWFTRAGHEVVYVTGRPVLAADATREWLTVNGFPGGALIFLPRGYKGLFALNYGIDWFFEDDPLEAQSLQGVVSRVFLKDWPYNRHVRGRGITRFKGWREILPCAVVGKKAGGGAFA
jgi:hypothetical protein